VLTITSNGIAALLIPEGRTTHLRFNLTITVDEFSSCGIHPKSPLSELIVNTKFIIWDDVCFEALDRSLRDILRHQNNYRLEFLLVEKLL